MGPGRTPVRYEVACGCGALMRGERHARHQILSCSGCGKSVFVLPRSPFEGRDVRPVAARRLLLRSWHTPVIAAVVCLVLVLTGFTLAWPLLTRVPGRVPPPVANDVGVPDVRQTLTSAAQALSQGKFHVARRLCDDAMAHRHLPSALMPEERRALQQLHRQAHLLANLSSRSLEEIVRQAMLVRDPEEWAAYFADSRGKTVVFDDVVRLDAEGTPVLANHVIEVGDAVARLALEDVTLLRHLPLEDSPRVIFGVRLLQCGREEGGTWVLRFEAESGVLLTDQGAVETCFSLAADKELLATLEQQRRWVEKQ